MIIESGNEFNVYGENTDDQGIPDIKGITEDDVSNYVYTAMSYPCIVFKDGFRCEKHKISVVQNMVKSISRDKDITVYIKNNGSLFKLGDINGLQLKSLIEIIGRDNLEAFYTDGTNLPGSLIYTLCTF